ncbi:MAG: hypothetical protein ACRDTM_05405 [Micromonosporaceae bacterium]
MLPVPQDRPPGRGLEGAARPPQLASARDAYSNRVVGWKNSDRLQFSDQAPPGMRLGHRRDQGGTLRGVP